MNIGALCVEGTVNDDLWYWNGKAREYGLERIKIVNQPAEIGGLSALIIPGGSSEVILDSIYRLGLDEPIKAMAAAGKHVWGRCAGLVCIAKTVIEPDSIINGENVYGPLRNTPLGLLPITVKRLGYPLANWKPFIQVRLVAEGIAYFSDGPMIVTKPFEPGERYFDSGFVWPPSSKARSEPEFYPPSLVRQGNVMGTSFWDGDEKLMRPLMKWWLRCD